MFLYTVDQPRTRVCATVQRPALARIKARPDATSLPESWFAIARMKDESSSRRVPLSPGPYRFAVARVRKSVTSITLRRRRATTPHSVNLRLSALSLDQDLAGLRMAQEAERARGASV